MEKAQIEMGKEQEYCQLQGTKKKLMVSLWWYFWENNGALGNSNLEKFGVGDSFDLRVVSNSLLVGKAEFVRTFAKFQLDLQNTNKMLAGHGLVTPEFLVKIF